MKTKVQGPIFTKLHAAPLQLCHGRLESADLAAFSLEIICALCIEFAAGQKGSRVSKAYFFTERFVNLSIVSALVLSGILCIGVTLMDEEIVRKNPIVYAGDKDLV